MFTYCNFVFCVVRSIDSVVYYFHVFQCRSLPGICCSKIRFHMGVFCALTSVWVAKAVHIRCWLISIILGTTDSIGDYFYEVFSLNNLIWCLNSCCLYNIVYSWISLSRSSRNRCKILSYPKFYLRKVRQATLSGKLVWHKAYETRVVLRVWILISMCINIQRWLQC